MLKHIGLHRPPVLGRLLDDRHVPDAAHGHVQRAGDRGGRQGQHVHVGGYFLDPLLLRHAEPLLLVHDEQPEILEFHILGQHPMGADEDVHIPRAHPADDLLLLLRRAEAGEHFHLHREPLEPPHHRVVMLERQDGGGHQQHALLALGHAFERRAQRHLRLAEAHVPAQQPIHRHRALHVPLDFLDAAELILRLLVFEPPLEIVLPLPVRIEGEPRGGHPLAVQGDKLLGDVPDRRAHPGLGLLPLLAPQAVELDLHLVLGADIFADQIQLGHRHVQGVPLVVLELEVVLDHPLHLQLVDPLVYADAVGRVHDVIPRLQLRQAVDLRALVPFGPPGGPPRRHPPVGDDRKPRLRELRSRRQPSLHDQHPFFHRCLRCGGVQGRDSLLGQIRRQGLGRLGFRPRQHHARHVPAQHILQILGQQLQPARPDGQLPRTDVVDAP